jgi:hypothetical protein
MPSFSSMTHMAIPQYADMSKDSHQAKAQKTQPKSSELYAFPENNNNTTKETETSSCTSIDSSSTGGETQDTHLDVSSEANRVELHKEPLQEAQLQPGISATTAGHEDVESDDSRRDADNAHSDDIETEIRARASGKMQQWEDRWTDGSSSAHGELRRNALESLSKRAVELLWELEGRHIGCILGSCYRIGFVPEVQVCVCMYMCMYVHFSSHYIPSY